VNYTNPRYEKSLDVNPMFFVPRFADLNCLVPRSGNSNRESR